MAFQHFHFDSSVRHVLLLLVAGSICILEYQWKLESKDRTIRDMFSKINLSLFKDCNQHVGRLTIRSCVGLVGSKFVVDGIVLSELGGLSMETDAITPFPPALSADNSAAL